MPVVLFLLLLTVTAAGAVDYDYDYIYVSADAAGTTEDGLSYGPGDILWSAGIPDAWNMYFDASDNGLGAHNISAFDIHENLISTVAQGPIYMSFSNRKVNVPGITGWVMSNDIVAFDEPLSAVPVPEDEYTLFFDGSDVGLTTITEGVNSLTVFMPEEYGPFLDVPFDCNAGLLFITTNANYRVPRYGGRNLNGPGGDILAFCATNLGSSTAGFWFRALRATDIELVPTRAIRNISVHDFAPGIEPLDPWYLELSFTSRTNFTLGLFEGEANVVYLYDTEWGITDTFRALNSDYPTLNGTADGLEIDLEEIVCADAEADC